MDDLQSVQDALTYIDPSCPYREWLEIGMALKDGGFNCNVWDEWSRSSDKYERGECARKWDSFEGSGITIATLFYRARKNGYKSDYVKPSVQRSDRITQIINYLMTLHDPEDYVGIVVDSRYDEKRKKWHPANDGYTCKVKEIIKRLQETNDISETFKYNPDAGMWIRVNPLDGFENKDSNVTKFKYALVESDDMSKERQKALMMNLRLPIKAMIDSGGKSIHAIVNIGAENETEYSERVRYLFSVCNKNGLVVDEANKNPSRMSRMPGVQRGNNIQELIGLNLGCETWDDWCDYIKLKETGLPKIKNLQTLVDNPPELATPLIEGILRKGRKMLISGASKTGKSFALIGLAYALAYGQDWMGFHCAKSKVLYLNLEIADDSFDHRMMKVSEALKITDMTNTNLNWLDMRGINKSLKELSNSLISVCKDEGYDVIILDPIYKVSFANENDAQEMADFCNTIDYICKELNVAMVYCHHHSKGSQSGKSAIDRMSGSGVLARDPDAIIDLLELEYTTEANALLKDYWERKIIYNTLDTYSPGWLEDVPDEDDLERMDVLRNCYTYRLSKKVKAEMTERLERELAAIDNIIPIRLSASVREFPPFAPINVYFKYPIHLFDIAEAFIDAKPIDQVRSNPKAYDKEEKKKKLKIYYTRMIDEENYVEVEEMAKALNVSEKTVMNYLREMPEFEVVSGTNRFKKAKFRMKNSS